VEEQGLKTGGGGGGGLTKFKNEKTLKHINFLLQVLLRPLSFPPLPLLASM